MASFPRKKKKSTMKMKWNVIAIKSDSGNGDEWSKCGSEGSDKEESIVGTSLESEVGVSLEYSKLFTFNFGSHVLTLSSQLIHYTRDHSTQPSTLSKERHIQMKLTLVWRGAKSV
jgi:hypothetical protein